MKLSVIVPVYKAEAFLNECVDSLLGQTLRDMEIILVETLRDVLEYAFVDCPRKQEYLDKLLPLNESGESTAVKLEPPKALPPRMPEGPCEETVTTSAPKEESEEVPEAPVIVDEGGSNPAPL